MFSSEKVYFFFFPEQLEHFIIALGVTATQRFISQAYVVMLTSAAILLLVTLIDSLKLKVARHRLYQEKKMSEGCWPAAIAVAGEQRVGYSHRNRPRPGEAH